MSANVDLKNIEVLHQDFLALDKRKTRDSLVPATEQRKLELGKFMDAYKRGDVYNPTLIYNTPLNVLEQKKLINDIRMYMTKLNPDPETLSGRIEIAYWEKAQGLLLQEESHINLSPSSLMSVTAYQYGIPSLELLDKARELLQQPYSIPEETTKIPSEDVVPIVQELFQRLGRRDWEILLVENVNARYTASTEHGKKVIKFRAGSEFALREITPTLMREFMATLRPENAEKNPQFPLLHEGFYANGRSVFGFYNYLEEKFLGQLEQERIRRSAARYLAAHVCLSGTFYDGFKSIVDFVGTDAALDITMRLKRGFANTAEPGCYLHDILYWDGFHRVKDHMSNNPYDLLLMCSGKVGLEDLPLVRDLVLAGIIRVPDFDPESVFVGLRDICEELVGVWLHQHPNEEDIPTRHEKPVPSRQNGASKTEHTHNSDTVEKISPDIDKIQIFISYKHDPDDEKVLKELLTRVQKDVEKAGAKFWWDKDIITGEIWHERIKAELAQSDIAIVLVSDDYLHSDYIEREEIADFIRKRKEEGMIIFPLIVSVCEWEKHDWLAQTQFMPKSGETIIGNYPRAERRKRLFIEVRNQLIEHINRKINDRKSGK